jgi:hypothetical protein
MAPSFFLAVSAARRAAHTGHGGITAGGVHGTSGRRNPCTVPWTSVPWTYSHSVNTSGSRVLRLRRSTRSKASRRSIMLLQVLRRLDRLRFPCRIIHSIGVVVPHRNLPERRPRTETSVRPVRFVRQSNSLSHVHRRTFAASLRRVRGQVSGFVHRCGLIFRSPGTTCRSMRRLRDSQNTCCLMGGRASLPVAADRRRGARSGR